MDNQEQVVPPPSAPPSALRQGVAPNCEIIIELSDRSDEEKVLTYYVNIKDNCKQVSSYFSWIIPLEEPPPIANIERRQE